MTNYKLDKTFLYMAFMTLPLLIIMPIMITIPLVLLILSIKREKS